MDAVKNIADKRNQINVDGFGVRVKGVIMDKTVTKKGNVIYSVAAGGSFVQLFTDRAYQVGEVVDIPIRLFDRSFQAREIED